MSDPVLTDEEIARLWFASFNVDLTGLDADVFSSWVQEAKSQQNIRFARAAFAKGLALGAARQRARDAESVYSWLNASGQPGHAVKLFAIIERGEQEGEG